MENLNHGNLRVPLQCPPLFRKWGLIRGISTTSLPEWGVIKSIFLGEAWFSHGHPWSPMTEDIVRCGVWWTSRRHDRDVPWYFQPCLYAVSPVTFVRFCLVLGWHVSSNRGSCWQYHGGPYCIQMERREGNGFILNCQDPTQLVRLNIVEHFTRRGVDLFPWRSAAVDWRDASHENSRLFKHYRLEGKESKRLSLEKFVSRLCNKMSKACPGKIHGGRDEGMLTGLEVIAWAINDCILAPVGMLLLLSFFSLVVQPDEDDVHMAPRLLL